VRTWGRYRGLHSGSCDGADEVVCSRIDGVGKGTEAIKRGEAWQRKERSWGERSGGGGLANANTMAEWAATGGGRWHSALRMERK
jgi:hypothetical protein